MRLLGNKTRLVGHIERLLAEKGVRGGTLIDIFCGTASVGRHFKARGFRVLSNDRLAACFTKAVATVELNAYPSFSGLLDRPGKTRSASASRGGAWRQATCELTAAGAAGGSVPREAWPTARALDILMSGVEPREGLIFRNFCPGGPGRRMYFTDENGKRLDGMLELVRESWRQGRLSREELHLLLSVLIDAADRVANISGTYGAYLKRFQRNASLPLSLCLPEIIPSSRTHETYQEDANVLARSLKGDVLYIDPPYNTRQYAANYHVLEIIASFPLLEDVAAFESRLYGKTGLMPYAELKSAYCVPRGRGCGGDVLSVMADLVLSSRVRHVVVSYNEEGLLSRDELGGILALFSGRGSFDFEENLREVSYRRFRSDSDRTDGSAGGRRRYKVIEGRARNEIAEWLLFASREPQSRGGAARGARRKRAAQVAASGAS